MYTLTNESKPNVIYEMPCKDWNEIYVGQTGRLLGVRLKKRKADCQTKNTKGRPLLNVNRSRAIISARSTSPYKTALRGHAVLKKNTHLTLINAVFWTLNRIWRKDCWKKLVISQSKTIVATTVATVIILVTRTTFVLKLNHSRNLWPVIEKHVTFLIDVSLYLYLLYSQCTYNFISVN